MRDGLVVRVPGGEQRGAPAGAVEGDDRFAEVEAVVLEEDFFLSGADIQPDQRDPVAVPVGQRPNRIVRLYPADRHERTVVVGEREQGIPIPRRRQGLEYALPRGRHDRPRGDFALRRQQPAGRVPHIVEQLAAPGLQLPFTGPRLRIAAIERPVPGRGAGEEKRRRGGGKFEDCRRLVGWDGARPGQRDLLDTAAVGTEGQAVYLLLWVDRIGGVAVLAPNHPPEGTPQQPPGFPRRGFHDIEMPALPVVAQHDHPGAVIGQLVVPVGRIGMDIGRRDGSGNQPGRGGEAGQGGRPGQRPMRWSASATSR